MDTLPHVQTAIWENTPVDEWVRELKALPEAAEDLKGVNAKDLKLRVAREGPALGSGGASSAMGSSVGQQEALVKNVPLLEGWDSFWEDEPWEEDSEGGY